MTEPAQGTLLSPLTDVAAVRILLADLHDDLMGKVARFHQLAVVSQEVVHPRWSGKMEVLTPNHQPQTTSDEQP